MELNISLRRSSWRGFEDFDQKPRPGFQCDGLLELFETDGCDELTMVITPVESCAEDDEVIVIAQVSPCYGPSPEYEQHYELRSNARTRTIVVNEYTGRILSAMAGADESTLGVRAPGGREGSSCTA